jgi:DNA primase
MDEKTLLFGAQYAKDAVIIVEGPFDSMAIGKGAVATLGIAVTTAQVNRLADYYKRVIVFDNEPNAQRRARALADQLSIYPGETFIVNIDAKDPAEAKPSEIAALRKFAGLCK